MSNILFINQPYVNVGLGTMTYTVPTTGQYSVLVDCTENPPTSLTILVKNGGSTIFTAPTITPTQGALQFKYSFGATAADVITVVLSSSAAIDNQLNTVKTIISIEQGA